MYYFLHRLYDALNKFFYMKSSELRFSNIRGICLMVYLFVYMHVNNYLSCIFRYKLESAMHLRGISVTGFLCLISL